VRSREHTSDHAPAWIEICGYEERAAPGTTCGRYFIMIRRAAGYFGACASLVLGKAGSSAVAEGSEFGQQVCQTIGRLVAEPMNRLGNIQLVWL
jgi:hypothetical protein